MSSLIPDLENIVGRLSDQKTYQTLIQHDPSIHTNDKLIQQEAKDIPVDDVLTLFNCYKIAREFRTEQSSERSLLNIASIILPFAEFFDLKSIDDLSRKIFYKMSFRGEKILVYITLSDCIIHILDKNLNPFDNLLNDDTLPGLLYPLISDSEKTYWRNYIHTEEFDDEQLFSILKHKIYEAVEYLVENLVDINLYNSKSYLDKLVKVMKFPLQIHSVLPDEIKVKYEEDQEFYDRSICNYPGIKFWEPIEDQKDKIISIIKNSRKQ